MTELKPCFCGEKPKIKLSKRIYCQMHGDPMQAYTYYCDNRSCKLNVSASGSCRYSGADEPKYDKQARQSAAEAWNTRPEEDRLKAELAKLKAQLKWHPIETAPKDGSEILVYANGYYLSRFSEEADFGWFEKPRKGWQVFVPQDNYYAFALEEDEPTHWRPLPSAPKKGE